MSLVVLANEVQNRVHGVEDKMRVHLGVQCVLLRCPKLALYPISAAKLPNKEQQKKESATCGGGQKSVGFPKWRADSELNFGGIGVPTAIVGLRADPKNIVARGEVGVLNTPLLAFYPIAVQTIEAIAIEQPPALAEVNAEILNLYIILPIIHVEAVRQKPLLSIDGDMADMHGRGFLGGGLLELLRHKRDDSRVSSQPKAAFVGLQNIVDTAVGQAVAVAIINDFFGLA